jgi:energy-coupling factor transporter ATP-binding protein EcfA2
MKLTELSVKNFSVVRNGSFTFSPQINVFLGRNGAGKSHVMKLLYSVLRAQREAASRTDSADLAAALKNKLAGVFRPDDQAVGRLVSRGTGRNTATIEITSEDAPKSLPINFRFTVSNLSKVTVRTSSLPELAPSVFLPSREALAMYEGFIQAYEDRELSFDETYRDLCVQLSGAQLRGPRLEAVRTLAQPLEQVLNGPIRLDGGRFYRTGQGGNLEAHLLSEGLRKIGVLTHLVLNGSLIKNGFLFWDEPEANLNPRLVTVIARTLRRLAGFGIQIFVATHDFLLLNELAMADDFRSELNDGAPAVDVRFIGLNLSTDLSHVTVQSADRLRDLESNDILEEFAAYYDRRNSLVAGTLAVTRNTKGR